MKVKKSLITTILLLLVSLNHCWDQPAHLLIATIAENTLKKRNSKKTISYFNSLIQEASVICGEGSHPLIESSSFLLKNKEDGNFLFRNFEFNRTAYNPNSSMKKSLGTTNWVKINYLSTQIYKAQNGLKSPTKNPFGKSDKKFTESIVSRFFISLMGDVHQPIHNIEYFDNGDFKEGDKSGNLYKVKKGNGKEISLFELWETAFGIFDDYNFESPLLEGQKETLDQLANDLMKEYPRSGFNDRLGWLDARVWSKEGYDLSVENVYSVKAGEVISDEYRKKGISLVKSQIVIAGYRLADYLDDIYQAVERNLIDNEIE